MLGDLGIEGKRDDPEAAPQALLPYDSEKEGSLGFTDRAAFVASFNAASGGKGRGSGAWSTLTVANMSVVEDTKQWESPEFLEAERVSLTQDLARVRGPSSRRQKLEALLGQVQERLEGKARGIPAAAFGRGPGEPFMFTEAGAPLETTYGVDSADIQLSWDALYKHVTITEKGSRSRMGERTRPILIDLLNSRIAAARETAGAEADSSILSERA